MGNLTGKELVEKGIITGPITEENIQQHGVDLNLIKVEKIKGHGYIPTKGKTVVCERVKMEPIIYNGEPVWKLGKGTYDITMAQGCNVPANQKLEIVQRSSASRNGVIIRSSLFDAGFYTSNIGTMMTVTAPIMIGVNARIAQIYATESNVVENLYDGQFQNDKQRNS